MNRILLNYLFNASYQLLVVFLPFITTPYIARVLGPVQIGVNAYSFSIIQISIIIGMVGIPLYGSRQIAVFAEKGREMLSREFWSIFIIQVIGMVVSIIFYLVYTFSLSDVAINISLLQGVHLLASMLDISWLLMGLQRLKEAVTRNFIFKVLSIILIFTFVKSEGDLDIYILIVSGTTLMGQVLLWYYAKKYIDIRFSIKHLRIKEHIKPVLVLFLPQILGQLYLSVDKVILNFFSTKCEVGYYDQALKIIKLVTTIVTSLGQVMLPSIASEFSKGNNEKIMYFVEKVLLYVLFVTIPMVMGLAGISSNFVLWFLGDDFISVAMLIKIMSPIILFIGLGSLFGIQILAATNQTNKLTLSILTGAVVSIVISFIFVPQYGVTATAIATLLAEGSVACIQFFFVKNYIQSKSLLKSVVLYIVASISMLVMIILINNVPVPPILKTFIQMGLGAILYIGILLLFKETFTSQIKLLIANVVKKKLKSKAT